MPKRLATVDNPKFYSIKNYQTSKPKQVSELNRCVIFVNSIANNYNKKRFDVCSSRTKFN